ncbi:MAG: hypothetical protein MJE68_02735 [Proteobacteria bacterium]|nr:hypothetical protein [Pseudomonadota bacterium]
MRNQLNLPSAVNVTTCVVQEVDGRGMALDLRYQVNILNPWQHKCIPRSTLRFRSDILTSLGESGLDRKLPLQGARRKPS